MKGAIETLAREAGATLQQPLAPQEFETFTLRPDGRVEIMLANGRKLVVIREAEAPPESVEHGAETLCAAVMREFNLTSIDVDVMFVRGVETIDGKQIPRLRIAGRE